MYPNKLHQGFSQGQYGRRNKTVLEMVKARMNSVILPLAPTKV
jgi:hypothetical protein